MRRIQFQQICKASRGPSWWEELLLDCQLGKRLILTACYEVNEIYKHMWVQFIALCWWSSSFRIILCNLNSLMWPRPLENLKNSNSRYSDQEWLWIDEWNTLVFSHYAFFSRFPNTCSFFIPKLFPIHTRGHSPGEPGIRASQSELDLPTYRHAWQK